MRSEVVGASGVRMGVRVDGGLDAPAIVFVHGWAQSARVWECQFADPQLRGRFRLLAPDLRVHGPSQTPEAGYDHHAVRPVDRIRAVQPAGSHRLVVGSWHGCQLTAGYRRVYAARGYACLVHVSATTEIGK